MNLFDLEYEFNSNVIYKDKGDMLMAYNQETSDMYEFNSVGKDIFLLLSKNTKMLDLFNNLNKEYNTKTEYIYDDTFEIVNRLIDLNVIKIKK